MKKIFIALCVCAVFAACSGNNSSSQNAETDTAMSDSDSVMAAKHTAKTTETNVDTNAMKTGATPGADTTRK